MDTKGKGLNVNEGHRNRLRGKFADGGLETFSEHEVLEMILFDCIPRKDTNKLAHELINRFGGLWQVFDAHPAELLKFKGMTQSAACSLSQYHAVQKYIDQNRAKNIKSIGKLHLAVDYARLVLADTRREECHAVCLDAGFKIIFRAKISEGTIGSVNVTLRELTETAIRHNAYGLVVMHSHPSGVPDPSAADNHFTSLAASAFNIIGIHFLDHIIIGENGAYYSYWENGAIRNILEKLNDFTDGYTVRAAEMLAQDKALREFYGEYHALNK